MAEDPVDEVGGSAVEQALAGGEPQRVGWFRFYFADERWEWSPQLQRMHGYEPGDEVEPTTELVLSHKHPADRRKVAAALEEIRRTAQAFSTEAIAEIAESRGVIEPAKGMMMLVYRIDADTAFELLRWRSQETNVKLRVLAQQIIADFIAIDDLENMRPRAEFDRLLLTAHTRIKS